MERITDRDITVTRHPADGFTLSCITNNGREYHKQRYISCGVKEAKRRFKRQLYDECAEEAALKGAPSPLTRDDVLLGALRCICGGNTGAAKELLGENRKEV